MATNPPPQLTKSKTVAVSDWFGFDWQYIVDLLRIPFIKEASGVIVAMPALVDVGFLKTIMGDEPSRSIWVTWAAALIYILFFVFGYLSCPRFIKEYRDFGEYLKRSHSNRFIGWEISKAINDRNVKFVFEELDEKGLATSSSVTQSQLIGSNLPRKQLGNVDVFGPNNFKVDLYIYFVRSGRVLELHLADDTVDEEDTTQRNLFWVVYSSLAKSRPIRRLLTWFLFWLAVITYIFALAWNVLRALE